MVKIMVDTCVWLDIAKSSNGDEILDLLSEFIKRKEIGLILPEIVVAEFKRNKDRVIAEANKSLSSHFKKVKTIISQHANQDRKQTILSQLDDIDKRISTLGESAAAAIGRIEKLMKKAEKISETDEIKLRAIQRAIDKRAPFHLSKNSVGDAIIIESYEYYRTQNLAQEFQLMFVTHNVNDFSVRDGNQKHPHTDFKGVFDASKSLYFISLPEALNTINSDLVDEFEFENEWDFDLRTYSEIMAAEKQFSDILWYTRHKYRERLIEQGDIKVIEKKNSENADSQTTILDHIWAGALKSAQKVEKKYGLENLKFSEFELGILYGKISALRWIIGIEWDNFDS